MSAWRSFAKAAFGTGLVALAIAGCTKELEVDCPVAAGASGTCLQACAQLFDLGCRVSASEEDCVELCTAATASLSESVRDRALACYEGAQSCSAADGCGRACGEDGGAIVFDVVDAGDQASDAGDAGSGL